MSGMSGGQWTTELTQDLTSDSWKVDTVNQTVYYMNMAHLLNNCIMYTTTIFWPGWLVVL